MSRAEFEQAAVEAQRLVTREVFGEALGDLLEVDLSMAQLKALAVIERQPGCTVGMLSEHLGVKAPAASLLADKLVRAGLAGRCRDRADGRRVIVRPTAEGAELVGRLRHGSRRLLESWVRQLADADLAALDRGLRALSVLATGLPVPEGAERARPAGAAGGDQ